MLKDIFKFIKAIKWEEDYVPLCLGAYPLNFQQLAERCCHSCPYMKTCKNTTGSIQSRKKE